MATSPEAFEQVKNILKKLDKSIDAARDRRLSSQTGTARTLPREPSSYTIGSAETLHNVAAQPRPTNRARPMLRRPDEI